MCSAEWIIAIRASGLPFSGGGRRPCRRTENHVSPPVIVPALTVPVVLWNRSFRLTDLTERTVELIAHQHKGPWRISLSLTGARDTSFSF